MKIKQNFVSNSSTTSYIIFGVRYHIQDIVERLEQVDANFYRFAKYDRRGIINWMYKCYDLDLLIQPDYNDDKYIFIGKEIHGATLQNLQKVHQHVTRQLTAYQLLFPQKVEPQLYINTEHC